jgi:hypothetical protein
MWCGDERHRHHRRRQVGAIEAGADDWHMLWRNLGATGWPTNAALGNRYSGGNITGRLRVQRVLPLERPLSPRPHHGQDGLDSPLGQLSAASAPTAT